MAEQKIRVRVKHLAEGKYEVQYKRMGMFQRWHELCFWFEQGPSGGTQCWSANLWGYEEAEEVARKLKLPNGLDDYYRPYEEEKAAWDKSHEEYKGSKIPYQTKEI